MSKSIAKLTECYLAQAGVTSVVHDVAAEALEVSKRTGKPVICEFNNVLLTVDYQKDGEEANERAVGRWFRDRDTDQRVRLERVESAAQKAVVMIAAALVEKP